MNPTADHRPPPHPHRPSFSCDLHPTEKFNGFCPSCLCDRLTTLNPSSSDAASSLYRRTKSFSSSNRNNVSFEPKRRSCDVRVRVPNEVNRAQKLDSYVGNEIRVSEEIIEEESRVRRVPIEAGRVQTLGQNVGEQVRVFEDLISRVRDPIDSGKVKNVNRNVGCEIRPFEEIISVDDGRGHYAGDEIEDDFEEEIAVEMEMKKMRDYIDLDFQAKKKKSSVGFWSAASVFSKKWNKWMKKQKAKKQSSGVERTVLPLGKTLPRKYRETQSEVADYGYGRRSCDTDPRFSIDIGRLSIDGPRPSFEPPRASWDGHMMRRSNYSGHRVSIADTTPGDSAQTHQYYLDTSSRRRKSFERSGSRNGSLVIGTEVDDNSVSGSKNARVTPETFDFHQRKSNSNSLRDECSEIFELGIGDDNSVIGNIEEKGSKKTGRWGKKWKFWGRNKNDEDDRYSRRYSVDRSSSVRGSNGNLYRRTSSVGLTNGSGKKKKDEFFERNRSVDNGLLKFYLTSPRNNNNNNGRVAGSKKSSKTDNSRPVSRGVFRY